ncbi:hypothetical protein G9A89_005425 [Geosiphon pyriformis]|nr:hypothetical protein G9A89_005425 [Geosiphon pyriformis]
MKPFLFAILFHSAFISVILVLIIPLQLVNGYANIGRSLRCPNTEIGCFDGCPVDQECEYYTEESNGCYKARCSAKDKNNTHSGKKDKPKRP